MSLIRYFSRFDDGEVVRWAFRGLLIGAIGVLALDLHDLSRENGWWTPEAAAASAAVRSDPAAGGETDAPMPSSDPRRFVTTDEAILGQPMTFTLGSGGVLAGRRQHRAGLGRALRRRDRGARRICEDRFAEFAGRRARRRHGHGQDCCGSAGIATEVADGALCASSCPLFFAGGKTRTAGAKGGDRRASVLCRRDRPDRAGAGDVRRAGDDRAHFAASGRHGRRPGALAACARYAAAGALLLLAARNLPTTGWSRRRLQWRRKTGRLSERFQSISSARLIAVPCRRRTAVRLGLGAISSRSRGRCSWQGRAPCRPERADRRCLLRPPVRQRRSSP